MCESLPLKDFGSLAILKDGGGEEGRRKRQPLTSQKGVKIENQNEGRNVIGNSKTIQNSDKKPVLSISQTISLKELLVEFRLIIAGSIQWKGEEDIK